MIKYNDTETRWLDLLNHETTKTEAQVGNSYFIASGESPLLPPSLGAIRCMVMVSVLWHAFGWYCFGMTVTIA